MNIQLTDKKIQIFESTLSLIHEFGFHGSPMSNIAKHAGVAVGSIYHYFPSKEDLIIELYWHCKEILNSYVFLEQDDNLPYELRFKNIWKNLVRFYISHAEIFSFLEQFYGSPFYQEVRQSIFKNKSTRNKTINFLEEGIHIKQLKVSNSLILISIYIGPIITLVRGCLQNDSPMDQQEVDELVNIIWNSVKF